MKSARTLAVLLGSLLALLPQSAQAWELFRSPNSEVETGTAQLEKGQVQEALSAYNEAAKKLPNEPGVHLARGTALLLAGKLPEAREALRIAAQGNASPEIRGKANYNLGLAFLQEAEAAAKQEQGDEAQKLLRESVDAFKSSLRATPRNRDAAWNYELAKRRLVEQEKKNEEKKKEQEKKDEEKKEQEKKDEEKKEQEKKEGEQDESDDQKKEGEQDKSDDQKKEGEQDKPDEQPDAGAPEDPKGEDAGAGQAEQPEPEPQQDEPQQAEPQEPAMPEHMRKALDALEDSEENLQKHRAATRARQRPRRIEKDW